MSKSSVLRLRRRSSSPSRTPSWYTPPVIPPPARTSAVLPPWRVFDSSRRSLATSPYRSDQSRMPFFYATRRDGDRVEIGGPDARHLAGPLRARPGELIAVVEPAGSLLTVRLDAVSTREVSGTVVGTRPHDPEPRLRVTMALAPAPRTPRAARPPWAGLPAPPPWGGALWCPASKYLGRRRRRPADPTGSPAAAPLIGGGLGRLFIPLTPGPLTAEVPMQPQAGPAPGGRPPGGVRWRPPPPPRAPGTGEGTSLGGPGLPPGGSPLPAGRAP